MLILIVIKLSYLYALDPTRILIVYNLDFTDDQDGDGVQDSSEVANYYSMKRGIPAGNIFGIHVGAGTASTTENFATLTDFFNDLATPLNNYLISIGSETIDTIVLCYGVPYFITDWGTSVDNAIMQLPITILTGPDFQSTFISFGGARIYGGYTAAGPTFETDQPNFAHYNTHMSTYQGGAFIYDEYLVSRLDGPLGVLGAMGLVDMAKWSDVYVSSQPGGYSGNIYINTNTENGLSYLQTLPNVQYGNFYGDGDVDNNINMEPYYAEDDNFFNFYTILWNGSETVLPNANNFTNGSPCTSAPKCLLYGGWYWQHTTNIFGLLAGSVFCDFNSFSLQGLREIANAQYTSGNIGSTQVEALMNGAAAVTGSMAEPETTGAPRPNVLLYYLMKGYSFGESAMLSAQMLGWMQGNVGDPMYAPFQTKTFTLDTSSPTMSSGYPRVQFVSTTSVNILIAASDSSEPEVVRSSINFGLSPSYGSSINTGLPYFRIEEVTLTGLTYNSRYHYNVVMTDPEGLTSTSQDFTFNLGTPPPSANPSSVGKGKIYNGILQ